MRRGGAPSTWSRRRAAARRRRPARAVTPSGGPPGARPEAAPSATSRRGTAARWRCSSPSRRRRPPRPRRADERPRPADAARVPRPRPRGPRRVAATIFLSSHVLSEVQRVADRVAVLRDRAGDRDGDGRRSCAGARASRVEAWFDEAAAGRRICVATARDGRCRPSTAGGSRPRSTGPIQPLLDLLARHRVASMLVEDPDLDDAFIDLYAAGGASPDAGAACAPATMPARRPGGHDERRRPRARRAPAPCAAPRRLLVVASASRRWSPSPWRSGRRSRTRRRQAGLKMIPPRSRRRSASRTSWRPRATSGATCTRSWSRSCWSSRP